MATSAIQGRKGNFSLSATTAAVAKVGEVENWEIQIQRDTIDATSFDSSGYKETVEGIMNWTARAGAISVSGNANQVVIRKQIVAATPAKCSFSFQPTTSATMKWTGSGYIRGVRTFGGTRDLVMLDVDIEGTGALTYTS